MFKTGCFALTEKFAGVNSGLVVQTQAHWNAEAGSFVLNSPTEGSSKNWISQGYTGTHATVVANLFVDDEPKGPHAFLIKLRSEDGTELSGITLADMGLKTIGNQISFFLVPYKPVL